MIWSKKPSHATVPLGTTVPHLKTVKLGNLCAFLNESGHLVLVAEQLIHNVPARLPLRDNCAQHRHTVHLRVLVKMTTIRDR
jgi:hypothetical protein